MREPDSSQEIPRQQSSVSLSEGGDAIEQEWWPKLQPYISKYETLWQMHVEPLRRRDSIYFRDGINEDFETFAMNHYTTFVNLARAFEKIELRLDDFKYAEEIWSNLQRASEVAKKASDAFAKIYARCTSAESRINLAKLENVTQSIKQYRNALHAPMRGTVKDNYGTRLIPRRDMLQKYFLWTRVMYHRDDSDFTPVETQLLEDFNRLCAILQDLWSQIENESKKLATNKEYSARRSVGTATISYGSVATGAKSTSYGSVLNPVGASGTYSFGPQGPVKKE